MLFGKRHDETPRPDEKPRAAPSQPSVMLSTAKRPAGPVRSVVDRGLLVTGNLEGEVELQIDGEVRGNIRCIQLIVGKDAAVDGDITADEIVVRGKVKGVMRADRVILQDGAHAESTIFHKCLTIEKGARFEGESCLRTDPKKADGANPKAAETKTAAQLNGKQGKGESAANGTADAGQQVRGLVAPETAH